MLSALIITSWILSGLAARILFETRIRYLKKDFTVADLLSLQTFMAIIVGPFLLGATAFVSFIIWEPKFSILGQIGQKVLFKKKG